MPLNVPPGHSPYTPAPCHCEPRAPIALCAILGAWCGNLPECSRERFLKSATAQNPESAHSQHARFFYRTRGCVCANDGEEGLVHRGPVTRVPGALAST